MIRKEEIVRQVKVLPGLPDSVIRLSALIQDHQASIEEIEKAVRPDLALTANLLRVANSAFYKRSKTVESVHQAISVLGEKRVYEMALANSVSRLIPDPLPGYGVSSKRFWMHNIAVAVFSERLARLLGLPDPEMVFTVGILHDVGKLVIGTFLADNEEEVTQTLWSNPITLLDVERQSLGTDHAEVGEAITRHWNLPDAIVSVTRWHHDPDQAPEEFRPLVDVTHIADSLSTSLGFGSDVGELARRVTQSSIDRLQVTTPQLERVAGDTLEQIVEMCDIFGSEEGGPQWDTKS